MTVDDDAGAETTGSSAPDAADHPPPGGLATGFGNADLSPGLALWRVTNAWQAKVRAALKPYDLTHMQFVLLASLTWLTSGDDKIVTQRDLAGHVGADTMMTSQVLRVLEQKALVVRESHPTDARARALRATSAGVALANRANVAVEAADARFFGVLGTAEPRLTALLGRLAAR